MSFRVGTSRTQGFTIVELLVVLAVIALLLGLLVPVLGHVNERARSLRCLANLRCIGQAVSLYCEGQKGQFPLSSHAARSLVSDSAWLQSLQIFGATPEVRLCPSDPDRAAKATSYATNEHFEPLTPGIDFNPVTRAPIVGGRTIAYRKLSSLPRPAAVIYAYEPEGNGTIDHLHTHQILSVEALQRSVAVTRHDGAANYLFADGHVATWAWSDLSASFSPPRQNPFDPATARVAP
jgi:general secretion pathway protein G